jgi:hypothetical protein
MSIFVILEIHGTNLDITRDSRSNGIQLPVVEEQAATRSA